MKLKAKLTEKEKGELVARLKGMTPEELAGVVDRWFVQDDAADGDFVLEVQSVDGWALEDVAGLKSTSNDWKEKAQKRKARLDAYGETSPDDVADLQARASRAGKKGSDDPDPEIQAKISGLESDRDKWRDRYRGTLHSSSIEKAMDEAKVTAKWRPAIRKHLESVTDILAVDGTEDFQVVVIGEGGRPKPSMKRHSGTNPMGVGEELSAMADSDDWSEMFDGTGRVGLKTQTGEPGETGKTGAMKNPFLPESRDMKLAAELKTEDPELYARFAKEAENAAFPES